MDDTKFNLIQAHMLNFAKEITIAVIGLMQDERIDQETQLNWINRIQQATSLEMPEVLERVQQEIKLYTVDTNIVN